MYVQQRHFFSGKQKLLATDSGMEARQGNQGDGRTIAELREVPQFVAGNFVLKADFDDGDEIFIQRAKNELRETPEVVQQALKDIRELLKGEPELIVPDDDEFYQKFLRPCKWYPKSAFELMKRFYQYRLNNPRYCKDLMPSTEKKPFLAELVIPLPDRTPDGCRLVVISAGKRWNPKQVSLDDIFRATMLSLDAAIAEPKTQISGVHVILDMDGFSLSQVTYFTPSFAASVAEWVQRCLPCRLKGIHVVNQPFIFNMVFAIFKPFLMEKTRKRIHFHGTNRSTLIPYTGTKILPKEFGGDFEMPKVPLGQGIWDYFCCFEKEFEASNKCGYVKSAKR
ncbi:alpha-tocopherol transfer protein isoform X1 [Megachile rotundata]|uniref:alpha-tocopherol transfer protein isoform X1 n=2 Tax=Megachile rotundata TaxID=143995 RepID=UPI00061511E3|nr:PREDICTED: alpha-tocopherol transfer protein-like isoform X1 [Megachile rotundata]XP_012151157.1 PREDICTED: alpha-tocopherol transfer protein-like isoform X1 [Megachile rotundata]